MISKAINSSCLRSCRQITKHQGNLNVSLRQSLVLSLSSRNKTLAIASNNYGETDIKVFCSFLFLLDLLTLCPINPFPDYMCLTIIWSSSALTLFVEKTIFSDSVFTYQSRTLWSYGVINFEKWSVEVLVKSPDKSSSFVKLKI